MADAIVPTRERYQPPAYRRRATLGDHLERLAPELRATPARAAAAALVAALVVVGAVALRPVEAAGVDDTGAFKAECGISMYLFGHPSQGVEQVCRDAYSGHAVALFAAGGAVVAAIGVLVVLLMRPVPPPATGPARGWRAFVATPGRAAAVAVATVILLVALGSLLPAHAEGDSRQGPFSAQCGISIFVFGHDDPAVRHACADAYGTRGRNFFGGIAAVTIVGVALAGAVHNERQRSARSVPVEPSAGDGPA